MDDQDRGRAIGLDFEQIDDCESAEQLHAWYFDCQELADDVIAQIEVNRVSENRGQDWLRRATGIVVGLKKKMKRIERHCAQKSIDLPDTKDIKQRRHINILEQKLLGARTTERKAVVQWLRENYPDQHEVLALAIEGGEHILFARSRQSEGAPA